MSEVKKYTISVWLKGNSTPFVYRTCTAYEKGSFYCVCAGGIVFKYPLVDIQCISELYEQNTRKFQKVHA